jgi:hypothetical protein
MNNLKSNTEPHTSKIIKISLSFGTSFTKLKIFSLYQQITYYIAHKNSRFPVYVMISNQTYSWGWVLLCLVVLNSCLIHTHSTLKRDRQNRFYTHGQQVLQRTKNSIFYCIWVELNRIESRFFYSFRSLIHQIHSNSSTFKIYSLLDYPVGYPDVYLSIPDLMLLWHICGVRKEVVRNVVHLNSYMHILKLLYQPKQFWNYEWSIIFWHFSDQSLYG